MLTNLPIPVLNALVGAFSVIVKTECETDGSSVALLDTLADL